MDLEEVYRRLAIVRQKQRELVEESRLLRNIIWENGGNPDDPNDDMKNRNKAIYQQYKNGSSFKHLAKQYNISAGRVRDICRRRYIGSS